VSFPGRVDAGDDPALERHAAAHRGDQFTAACKSVVPLIINGLGEVIARFDPVCLIPPIRGIIVPAITLSGRKALAIDLAPA
jgi:hypothetical protein